VASGVQAGQQAANSGVGADGVHCRLKVALGGGEIPARQRLPGQRPVGKRVVITRQQPERIILPDKLLQLLGRLVETALAPQQKPAGIPADGVRGCYVVS
jgi:hypothetical protein